MGPRSGLGPVSQAKDETYITPALDFSNREPSEGGIRGNFSQIYHPISAIDDDGPYEFRVRTNASELLHAPLTRVGGEVQILKSTGEHTTDTDDVSVCNLPIDSMFGAVVVEMESVKIEDTSYCYPYKAFWEKTLSYNRGAKDTHMQNAIYHDDTANFFDTVEGGKGNEGLDRRAVRFKNSKVVHFYIPLSLDISTITKPLPNNTSYVFRFSRNSDAFVLMTNGGYKIHLKKLYLEVVKLIPQDNVLQNIERRFNSSGLTYEVSHTKIVKYSIPAGVYEASQYSVFDKTTLPRFVMLGLVKQSAFSGNKTNNPFRFIHGDMNEVSLLHNNVPIPSTPFRPNWDSGDFYRMYGHFFDNLGHYHGDSTNGITPEQFSQGLTLIAFDLSPDKCNGHHRHRDHMHGEISIRMNFKKQTPQVLTLLVYAVFESSLTVSKNEGVVPNYIL